MEICFVLYKEHSSGIGKKLGKKLLEKNEEKSKNFCQFQHK